jgi:phospholipid transport system substrate-binding protein
MLFRSAARLFLVVLCLAGAAVPSRAADDPAGFIADLGKRAIDVLTSKQSPEAREAEFRKLFDEGFDVPAIAQFVLGPYGRSASEQQRSEFAKLFESYVVHAYTVRFSEYSGQQFKVLGSRAEGEKTTAVSSQIGMPNGAPPVKVDWRVAKVDGGFKITDVIVEGVSMAVTQRQEFSSVIQRNGGQIDALLKLLREKTGAS